MEKEDKENAYLTCPMSGACYQNMLREDLFQKALKTNKIEDWGEVPMCNTMIDCFNMECLMCKDYKQAAKLLDKRHGYRK